MFAEKSEEELVKQQTTPTEHVTSFRVNSSQSFSPYNVLENPIYSGSPSEFESYKRKCTAKAKKTRIAIPVKQFENQEFVALQRKKRVSDLIILSCLSVELLLIRS